MRLQGHASVCEEVEIVCSITSRRRGRASARLTVDLYTWLFNVSSMQDNSSSQKLGKAIDALKRQRLEALAPAAAGLRNPSARKRRVISESKARHALSKTIEVEVAGGMMVKAVVDAKGPLEMRASPAGFTALKAFVMNFELSDESSSPSPSSASGVELPKGVYFRRDDRIHVLTKSMFASLSPES